MEKHSLVPIDGYLLQETEYNETYNKMYEGLMAQGNGYLHVRATFEEGLLGAPQDERYLRTMKSVTTEKQRDPLSKNGCYLPPIMGRHPLLGEVILNLPCFLGLPLYAGQEKLDMRESNVTDYRRVLYLSNGLLRRTLTWQTDDGAVLRCEFSRFASMSDKHLFVQQLRCEVLQGETDLSLHSGIDASVTTNGYNHFQEAALGETPWGIHCRVGTDLEETVEIETLDAASLPPDQLQVCGEQTNRRYRRCQWHLAKGDVLSYTKYTAVACSRDENPTGETIQGTLEKARGQSFDALLQASSLAWAGHWGDADIALTGDEPLQSALRFSIYHLIRCNTGQDDRVQVCAKGFAGEAYYGRYFWDSEMYLLPFYLYTNPQAARNLVSYRYRTLDGARKNAAALHGAGARYPWQSAITGEEQCSLWEYADNEVHITADVAFAVMHYHAATGDDAFLLDQGFEILLETARYWVTRVDITADGKTHLLNVMGPDEYTPMSRDNAFTNRMVRENLNACVAMAGYLEARYPEAYGALKEKLDIAPSEYDRFAAIAKELPIPYDEERGLFLQCEDFEQFPMLDIDGLWRDRTKAFGHFVSQEKIYRSRCIKQADVIAMMTLFPDEFTPKQQATAYDYYKPYTTHDSSLSPAGHSILAGRIGRQSEVEAFVQKTIDVDLCFEKQGAQDGIHIANCGALWQTVVQGFLGVRPAYLSRELAVTPNLPPHITGIQAPYILGGKQHRIAADQKGQVSIVQRRPRGFLFDLDGVLTDTAEYHYQAWKELADSIGAPFDRQVNEKLKGVSRNRSLEIILENGNATGQFSPEQMDALAQSKNQRYRQLIQGITPADLLPCVGEFLACAKEQGIGLAVASASKNALDVLESLQILPLFDYVADAAHIPHAKPHPQVFLDCARALGVRPAECIGFEDAQSGIEAIKAAGMVAVGIHVTVESVPPDIALGSTEELPKLWDLLPTRL